MPVFINAQKNNHMENVTAQEQQNMDTVLRLLNNFKAGNLDVLDELVHDDFINHHAEEGMQDKAGFSKIVEMVHGAFSSFDEFDLKPAHLFAKGNMVAMMDQGEGKLNGEVYRHTDIHIFIMKDGKMYQHWNSFGLPCQKDVLMNFMPEKAAG